MELPLINKLCDLMGYIQNNSEVTLKLYQDDATRSYHMTALAYNGTAIWKEWGDSLEQLINKAWDKHGADCYK